jgi:hypothetical protein
MLQGLAQGAKAQVNMPKGCLKRVITEWRTGPTISRILLQLEHIRVPGRSKCFLCNLRRPVRRGRWYGNAKRSTQVDGFNESEFGEAMNVIRTRSIRLQESCEGYSWDIHYDKTRVKGRNVKQPK